MAGNVTSGVALVTGAAHRLGRAMSLYLGRRGVSVALHYSRSGDAAEELASELRAMGVAAQTFRADLLELDQAEALVGQVAGAMGPLSLLINNASIFEYDTLQTATQTGWDRHFRSNLQAPFILTQHFAAQVPDPERNEFGEAEAGGLVVNMLDQRVAKPTPEFMTYSLAKAGLWAFTRTAAQALGPRIRVNGIGPGSTLRGSRQSEEHFRAQRMATILQRGPNPSDITAALGYLIDAPAVTGQLICVDGGQHLGWKTPDILGVE